VPASEPIGAAANPQASRIVGGRGKGRLGGKTEETGRKAALRRSVSE
jgi:hypothetical protein